MGNVPVVVFVVVWRRLCSLPVAADIQSCWNRRRQGCSHGVDFAIVGESMIDENIDVRAHSSLPANGTVHRAAANDIDLTKPRDPRLRVQRFIPLIRFHPAETALGTDYRFEWESRQPFR